jgi:hypothetical protein
VRCWGEASKGQLGYGNGAYIDDASRAGDVSIGGPAVQLVVGSLSSCAILTNGNARCWGYGNFSAPDPAHVIIGDDELPSSMPELNFGGKITQLDLSDLSSTCAVLEGGEVRCVNSASSNPLGATAVQVSLGSGYVCGVLSNGNVRCSYAHWGYPDNTLFGSVLTDMGDIAVQ